ncbi:MAG: AAA family ATPase, partial [Firmicutes bacterium]|nr:AAA family ATPase [Bacillota bacterium]
MNVPVIAFFNNKGGVGKTSLVYHVAWMLAEQGKRVVAVDLDPQVNLSAAFLEDDRLEKLWEEEQRAVTIYHAIQPLKRGIGDIAPPVLEAVGERLALLPGHMALSEFEDQLSEVWPKCLDRDERAFRVLTSFWRVIQKGAEEHRAAVVLIDLGPNLGAINRAALVASDFVVIPLGPDLFSLQGLRNLGPKLREWRQGWQERIPRNPDPTLSLPAGSMEPIGYIVTQHSVRRDRPAKSYEKWIARIPGTYRQAVLGYDGITQETTYPRPAGSPSLGAVREPPLLERGPGDELEWGTDVTRDPHCFALLKHYRSLMPMAQEA